MITNRVQGATLKSDQKYTNRPFTVAVCRICPASAAEVVMPKLQDVVRHCPHAVLMVTHCLLGPISCAGRDSGDGVTVLLQPCDLRRAPVSAGQWIGPIRTEADAMVVADWIAEGAWDGSALPTTMRLGDNLARSSRLN